jgi:hypothetical protein
MVADTRGGDGVGAFTGGRLSKEIQVKEIKEE